MESSETVFGEWYGLPGWGRTTKERRALVPVNIWVLGNGKPMVLKATEFERWRYKEEWGVTLRDCDERWTIYTVSEEPGPWEHQRLKDYSLDSEDPDHLCALTKMGLLEALIRIETKKLMDIEARASYHRSRLSQLERQLKRVAQ